MNFMCSSLQCLSENIGEVILIFSKFLPFTDYIIVNERLCKLNFLRRIFFILASKFQENL
jgi:hypothetical protein